MSNFQLAASFSPWAMKSPSSSNKVITHDQGTWHLVCSPFSTSEIHLRRQLFSRERSRLLWSSLRSLLQNSSRGRELNPECLAWMEANRSGTKTWELDPDSDLSIGMTWPCVSLGSYRNRDPVYFAKGPVQCPALEERWVILKKSHDSSKEPQRPLCIRWEKSPYCLILKPTICLLWPSFILKQIVVFLLPFSSLSQKTQAQLCETQKRQAGVSKMSPQLIQRILLSCPSVLMRRPSWTQVTGTDSHTHW